MLMSIASPPTSSLGRPLQPNLLQAPALISTSAFPRLMTWFIWGPIQFNQGHLCKVSAGLETELEVPTGHQWKALKAMTHHPLSDLYSQQTF